MFPNFSAGLAVSMHDSRVLKNCSLFHKAKEGNILSYSTDVIEKIEIGPVLLGDWKYPLYK